MFLMTERVRQHPETEAAKWNSAIVHFTMSSVKTAYQCQHCDVGHTGNISANHRYVEICFNIYTNLDGGNAAGDKAAKPVTAAQVWVPTFVCVTPLDDF